MTDPTIVPILEQSASARTLLASAIAAANASIEAQRAAAEAQQAANVALADVLKQAGASDQVMAALSLALQAYSPPAPLPASVRDFGAVGNGQTNDTTAIQKAFDAGVYLIPAGVYLIDTTVSLWLRKNGAKVVLHKDAVLKAIPNAAIRYYVLRITGSDITVTGGSILGDRQKHTDSTTSTGEWGYGVMIGGSRNVLEEMLIAECNGDGIGVSGDEHIVRHCTATRNRRQGMSVYTTRSLKVLDSEFSYTGALLASDGVTQIDEPAPYGPCAGMDIEPDDGSAIDVLIERCRFIGNRAGLLGWIRAAVNGRITAICRDCVFTANSNGSWLCDELAGRSGSVNVLFERPTITQAKGNGIKADQGSVATIDGGIFDHVGDRTDVNVSVLGTSTSRDIAMLRGGKATLVSPIRLI